MKIEANLHSSNDERRRKEVEVLNRRFKHALSWHSLILQKSGIAPDNESLQIQMTNIEKGLDTRRKRAKFVNQTSEVLERLFHVPVRSGYSAELYDGLSLLAFSDDSVKEDDLPRGISRVTLVESVIRIANGCPESIETQMLSRLSKSLGYENCFAPMGRGVTWNIDE